MREILWHPKALVLVCLLLAVGALTMLVRRALAGYERAFVQHVGAGLKYNFIAADARTVFALSAVATIISALVGFYLLGVVGAVAGVLIGALAPRLALRQIAKVRIKRFIYQLPDALLALASALRAGSNLTKGLELLSARQPAPLSQEFTIVLAEHRVGRQLAESLADMRGRIDTPEIDLMNTAINVSRRVGGNLADTLESLAKTLQEKAHIEGKIDALTAMGRAQGWVVGLLPVFIGFVLYQQQPDRMSLLFTEWYGWVVLAVVATMMAVAAWMIRKIVNIDV
jgi:tight adherence protein B